MGYIILIIIAIILIKFVFAEYIGYVLSDFKDFLSSTFERISCFFKKYKFAKISILIILLSSFVIYLFISNEDSKNRVVTSRNENSTAFVESNIVKETTQTVEKSIVINVQEELVSFIEQVNNGDSYKNKIIEFSIDIDISNIKLEATGNFEGTLDGKGHEIKINIDTDKSYQGLFATNKGVIKNLTISGNIKAGDYTGAVCAVNDGTIQNCNNLCKVESVSINDAIAYSRVGGICSVNNGTVANCYNKGNIKSRCKGDMLSINYAGGICGINNGEINNCGNFGSVSDASLTGGISGTGVGTINNCYNTGDIQGENTGGISGACFGTIKQCYNKGVVSGTVSIGGICGVLDTVVDENTKSYKAPANISMCYNIGVVKGTRNDTGGIAGSVNGEISECYNIGSVKNGICGMIGSNEPYGSIAAVSLCYYLSEKSPRGMSSKDFDKNIIALTKNQFSNSDNFSNWYFGGYWKMDSELGRPVLITNNEKQTN